MAWSRERPHSFQEALRVAREMLAANAELIAKGTIETEAEQLVLAAYRAAVGKTLSRLELFSRVQDRFPEDAADRLLIFAGSRAAGKPLQHVIGAQVFLEHEYQVGPDVLIPRPETELLVTLAIQELEKNPPTLGLEVGLGSGAISIELLAAFPALTMVSSELTLPARARARSNADRILHSGSDRLRIVEASDPLAVMGAFEGVLNDGLADFLISNPPYLTESDPIEGEVKQHEPASALFAPSTDPLHFYRQIALEGGRFLKPGASVFLELAPERALQTLELFEQSGWPARIVQDLTQRDRFLFASFPFASLVRKR